MRQPVTAFQMRPTGEKFSPHKTTADADLFWCGAQQKPVQVILEILTGKASFANPETGAPNSRIVLCGVDMGQSPWERFHTQSNVANIRHVQKDGAKICQVV